MSWAELTADEGRAAATCRGRTSSEEAQVLTRLAAEAAARLDRGQGVEDLRAALGGTASLTELQLFESRVVRDQENLFHLLIVATGEVVGERGVMDKAARLRFEEIASELVPKP